MTERIPFTTIEVAPDNEALMTIMGLSGELSKPFRQDHIRDAQIALFGEVSNTSYVTRAVKDGKRLRPRKIDNLSIVQNSVLVSKEVVRAINMADKPNLRLRLYLPVVDNTDKHLIELDENNPSYSVDIVKYREDGWKNCAKDTRYEFEFNSNSFAYSHDPNTDNYGWAKLEEEFSSGALSMPERLRLFMGKLSTPTYVGYQTWLDTHQ